MSSDKLLPPHRRTYTDEEIEKFRRSLETTKAFRKDRVARYRASPGRRRESTLQASIVRYASRNGFFPVVIKKGGMRGIPDLLLIGPNGVIRFVEVKVPGGRVTDSQRVFAGRLERRGVNVAVVWNLTEAIEVMSEMLNEN